MRQLAVLLLCLTVASVWAHLQLRLSGRAFRYHFGDGSAPGMSGLLY
jgi:hypothetical protein